MWPMSCVFETPVLKRMFNHVYMGSVTYSTDTMSTL